MFIRTTIALALFMLAGCSSAPDEVPDHPVPVDAGDSGSSCSVVDVNGCTSPATSAVYCAAGEPSPSLGCWPSTRPDSQGKFCCP